jgi:hypothetical protein
MPALLACVALAAASLALPFEPVYDAWAWLVWGREVGTLELDTTAGPSWKPLPVLIDTGLAPFGGIAPELWLILARAGWLLVLVAAFRLAGRLARDASASGWVAGVVAAAGVGMLWDPFTPWLRQFAGGLGEPLLVALVLVAVERALARRPAEAVVCGTAAALLRPEAWPFLALYAGSLARGSRRRAALASVLGLAVLAAWFLPDLIGAGDPLEGAARARSQDPGLASGTEAVGRWLEMPPWGIWPFAIGAVAVAWRRGPAAVRLVGALALAWALVVALLALGGYAGLPRFSAPAAALVCVLGGTGSAIALSRLGPAPGRAPRAAAIAGAAVLLVSLVIRALALDDDYREAERLGARSGELVRLIERAGEPPPGCPRVQLSEPLARPALAWELDRSMADIEVVALPSRAAGLTVTSSKERWSAAVRARLGSPVAIAGPWTAYRPCEPR